MEEKKEKEEDYELFTIPGILKERGLEPTLENKMKISFEMQAKGYDPFKIQNQKKE